MEALIQVFEKAKENSLSFILGLVVSLTGTYIVLDKFHSKQLQILQLESKVKIDKLEAEISSLNQEYQKLKTGSLAEKNIVVMEKTISQINDLINKLDAEIKIKKQQISMAAFSRITLVSENEKSTSEKTGLQLRLERELEDLQKQRNIARQKQIDMFGKLN